jgi:hypothetical protein
VGELAGWVNALPALGTAGVATGILRSPEADARLVDALYLKILGRAADPAGETGWVNLLEQGASEEQVAAAFLSSPEFAARAAMLATAPASPNLDRTYIDALYAVLLGRTASAGEIGGWLGVLPALGRSGVAKAFMGSVEFRGDVIGSLYFSSAPMQLVPLAGIAPNLLHRTAAASAAETAGWVNSGMDILSIEVAFAGLSGGEFFNDG